MIPFSRNGQSLYVFILLGVPGDQQVRKVVLQHTRQQARREGKGCKILSFSEWINSDERTLLSVLYRPFILLDCRSRAERWVFCRKHNLDGCVTSLAASMHSIQAF